MLFEGTSLYFWLLFLVFLLVYITVKICLGSLFKKAREKAWKGYIPIYSTYELIKLLDMKKSLFYMTLIPFVNLYYYNIIIKKLLEAFAQNPKNSILYIIFPMYKFPELIFKDPVYVNKNTYELTNEFIDAQNVLFNKPKEELPEEIKLVDVNKAIQQNQSDLIIEPSNYNQNLTNTNQTVQNQNAIEPTTNTSNDNVYATTITDDEKNKVTYVEAKQEEKKEEKPIITPLDQGKEKVCPKCGTRLSPSATTCFMCGTILS